MGLFDFFKKKKTPPQITDLEREQFLRNMIGNAEAMAAQFKNKANLDFSVESLEILDKILEENTDVYRESDNETKRKIIIKAGSYIFEVARQNFGGNYYWYEQLDQPILVTGQPEYEMSLLAYEKVKGRFENGIEDSIPFFFEGYINGVKNKATQMIV